MKKIKVVHLVECAGGVDIYLRMLLSGLNKDRFENVLICSFDYNAETYKGIAKVYQIEMINALSLTKDTKAVCQVRRLMKQIKPDILYCHSSKAGGIGRLAALNLDIITIYNPHGWAFNIRRGRKTFLYTLLERLLSRITTKIITISNYEKIIALAERIAPENKIVTIFSGIDLDKIYQYNCGNKINRSKLGIREDSYLIGMVGRISAHKAPDIFVRVASVLKEKIPHAEFMIVGDGDLRNEIDDLIAYYNLSDCFHITGWVNNAVEYIHMFDQGILLSRCEGFGLAVAEYMANGIPVVATECQGIKDLITNYYNGLLVPIDNIEMAVNAVMEIYTNIQLRCEIIKNEKLKVNACFDIKRTILEHENLFVKLCAESDKH